MDRRFARSGTGRGRTCGHATVQGCVVDASGGSVCAPSTDESSGWPASSHFMFDWRGWSRFASDLAVPSILPTLRLLAAWKDRPGNSGEAALWGFAVVVVASTAAFAAAV